MFPVASSIVSGNIWIRKPIYHLQEPRTIFRVANLIDSSPCLGPADCAERLSKIAFNQLKWIKNQPTYIDIICYMYIYIYIYYFLYVYIYIYMYIHIVKKNMERYRILWTYMETDWNNKIYILKNLKKQLPPTPYPIPSISKSLLPGDI